MAQLPVPARIAVGDIPTELWREIMLKNSHAYCILALTCRAFRIDTNVAKNALTHERRYADRIIYCLPCRTIHRGDDKPAIVQFKDGAVLVSAWCQNNMYHRDGDLPAVIYSDGERSWYQHGLCHRDNGPAVIHSNGACEWYRNGKPCLGAVSPSIELV